MIAVVIKIEGMIEGVQAFSTREKAIEAINTWEKKDWQELVDDGDNPGEFEPIEFGENQTITDPDDSYGGFEFQLVDGVELDGE